MPPTRAVLDHIRAENPSSWHSRYVTTPARSPALLVVEDDRSLSAMLAELFTDEGYRVDTAYDGQQGLHRSGHLVHRLHGADYPSWTVRIWWHYFGLAESRRRR